MDVGSYSMESAPHPECHLNFLAPVHGYYQFMVQKESNGNKASFRVFKDGVQMLYNAFYSGGDVQPVTASSFILELQMGEKVQIKNVDSSEINGEGGSGGPGVYRSWFSGFLLYRL